MWTLIVTSSFILPQLPAALSLSQELSTVLNCVAVLGADLLQPPSHSPAGTGCKIKRVNTSRHCKTTLHKVHPVALRSCLQPTGAGGDASVLVSSLTDCTCEPRLPSCGRLSELPFCVDGTLC